VPVLAGSLYGFRGVMFLDYGDAWEYTFTCVASAATGRGGERVWKAVPATVALCFL
jgi:hypothetical protein